MPRDCFFLGIPSPEARGSVPTHVASHGVTITITSNVIKLTCSEMHEY